MIKIQLAKSLMENEEGLNHLWIQLQDASFSGKQVRIDIDLPEGVYRSKNANGYVEDEAGSIQLKNVSNDDDVLIEMYTREPVSCGLQAIKIVLQCADEQNQVTQQVHHIPLHIVNEEEMDDLVVDEEVVARLKLLAEQDFVSIQPRILVARNELSPLEKKYRIDF